MKRAFMLDFQQTLLVITKGEKDAPNEAPQIIRGNKNPISVSIGNKKGQQNQRVKPRIPEWKNVLLICYMIPRIRPAASQSCL